MCALRWTTLSTSLCFYRFLFFVRVTKCSLLSMLWELLERVLSTSHYILPDYPLYWQRTAKNKIYCTFNAVHPTQPNASKIFSLYYQSGTHGSFNFVPGTRSRPFPKNKHSSHCVPCWHFSQFPQSVTRERSHFHIGTCGFLGTIEKNACLFFAHAA